MPPKRNAYTFFVRERSRAGGPLNPALFARYDQEWKDLDATSKERYHQMARDERDRDYLSVASKDPFRDRTASQNSSISGSVSSKKSNVATSASGGPPLKMSEIIMEVAHGAGEVIVSERFPDAVKNDIPTPTGDDYDQLQEVFHQAMTSHYTTMDRIIVQNVLVISVIPVTSADTTQYVINRPLEIAIESFRITTGRLEKSLFHAFVDPGELPPGSTLSVTECRRNYHQIPAASYIKSDPACRLFNEKFKLAGNYYEIYRDIVKITEYNPQKNTMIPLLAGETGAAATGACLKWLHDRAMEKVDQDGLPNLPELVISTVEEFCANILHLSNKLDLSALESVQRTFAQKRYHTFSSLRCFYHQEVDSAECARGTANDKIYSTFDFLRGIGMKLPNAIEFRPQAI